MSDHEEEQKFLYELLSRYSQDLNELLNDLTTEFQEEMGNISPLYLHIQLLGQHLGKVIAGGPKDMREDIIKEARIQENLVIEDWDKDDDLDLSNMQTKGSA